MTARREANPWLAPERVAARRAAIEADRRADLDERRRALLASADDCEAASSDPVQLSESVALRLLKERPRSAAEERRARDGGA